MHSRARTSKKMATIKNKKGTIDQPRTFWLLKDLGGEKMCNSQELLSTKKSVGM